MNRGVPGTYKQFISSPPPAPSANPTPSDVTQDNYKGSMYDFTDPKRIGPGGWHYMHTIGKWADELEHKDNSKCTTTANLDASKPADVQKSEMYRNMKQDIACQLIKEFCDNFKCGKCNGHCHNYVMKTNSPKKMIGVPDGIFYWTIEFRNAVNRRLGRPTFDPEIMKKIFFETAFLACDEGCGADEDKDKETPSNNTTTEKQPEKKNDIVRYPEHVDLYVSNDKFKSLEGKLPAVIQPLQPQLSQPFYLNQKQRKY